MAQNEVVDEVVPHVSAGRNASRPAISESVGQDGHSQEAAAAQDTVQDTVRARTIRDTTAKLLDKLEAESGDDGDADETAAPVDTDEIGLEGAPTTETAETKTEAVDANGNEIERYKAESTRLSEANKRLLEELETVKKTPRGELSAREKALDEAERMYLEDNVGAIRRVIATVLGVDDPNHKDVDAELSGLYVDLTSRELNVPLEASHKATREAVRARQLLARDKRERKAEEDAKANRASEDDKSRRANEAATFIENRLSTKRTDGVSIAESHPLLMTLAEAIDGLPPTKLLWKAIEQGVQAGKYDPASGDDNLIAAAAKDIEEHYTRLSERFAKAKPQKVDAATAAPATAVDQTSNDQRQGKATRTITNASASVAPATPVKKAEPTATETPPKFKSNKERREWALRHLR